MTDPKQGPSPEPSPYDIIAADVTRVHDEMGPTELAAFLREFLGVSRDSRDKRVLAVDAALTTVRIAMQMTAERGDQFAVAASILMAIKDATVDIRTEWMRRDLAERFRLPVVQEARF